MRTNIAILGCLMAAGALLALSGWQVQHDDEALMRASISQGIDPTIAIAAAHRAALQTGVTDQEAIRQETRMLRGEQLP